MQKQLPLQSKNQMCFIELKNLLRLFTANRLKGYSATTRRGELRFENKIWLELIQQSNEISFQELCMWN
jgi:hypothetical protein